MGVGRAFEEGGGASDQSAFLKETKEKGDFGAVETMLHSARVGRAQLKVRKPRVREARLNRGPRHGDPGPNSSRSG